MDFHTDLSGRSAILEITLNKTPLIKREQLENYRELYRCMSGGDRPLAYIITESYSSCDRDKKGCSVFSFDYFCRNILEKILPRIDLDL